MSTKHPVRYRYKPLDMITLSTMYRTIIHLPDDQGSDKRILDEYFFYI